MTKTEFINMVLRSKTPLSNSNVGYIAGKAYDAFVAEGLAIYLTPEQAHDVLPRNLDNQ